MKLARILTCALAASFLAPVPAYARTTFQAPHVISTGV